MSTKQTRKSFRIAVNQASQNTRLIDRMTEILLTFKKPHREENKLPPNSKIQKTDPVLVSLVRELLHLLTVEKFLFHSAAEFLCERKSSIFKKRQKSCRFRHDSLANSTSNSDRTSSF